VTAETGSEPQRRTIHDIFPEVYAELRQLAARRIRRDGSASLQPTALVHELFVRFVEQRPAEFADERHFMAVAARAMRAILTDRARARAALKRGGHLTMTLTDVDRVADARRVDALALEESLARLETLDARQARIVELRYFGGMTVEETASALDLSPTTVKREWRAARAWLLQELDLHAPPGRPGAHSLRRDA
jgi:RNA polymerase sigma factor (TIGR02999 family)